MSTTSAEVIVLVAVMVVASVYAFICGIREDRVAREIRRWVVEHHPERWRALPWLHRQWFASQIAVRALERTALASDPAFAARWQRARRLRRAQAVGYTVSMACVLLALFGSRWWGWRW